MSADQWVSPPFEEMTPRAQAIALEWYGLGCRDGYGRGWDAYHEQEAALQRRAVASAQAVASRPSYAERCDMWGEPERAAEARARMARIDREMGWVA